MENRSVHYIVGVHITNRVTHVPQVQSVLTEFGCFIKTRIGLHELSDETCSPNGLLIVEFIGNEQKLTEFVEALKAVKGVDVQRMTFKHN